MKLFKRTLAVLLVMCIVLSTVMLASAAQLDQNTNNTNGTIFEAQPGDIVTFGEYPQDSVGNYFKDDELTFDGNDNDKIIYIMSCITADPDEEGNFKWDEDCINYTGMDAHPEITWNRYCDADATLSWYIRGSTREQYSITLPGSIPNVNNVVVTKMDDALQYTDITINDVKYRIVKKLYDRPENAYTAYNDLFAEDEDTNDFFDRYEQIVNIKDAHGQFLPEVTQIEAYYIYTYSPIEWIVTENDDGFLTLVTKDRIDATYFESFYSKSFNGAYIELKHPYCNNGYRKFLNNDFFNTAFNAEEQSYIPIVKNKVSTCDNTVNLNGRTVYKANNNLNKDLYYWNKVSLANYDTLNKIRDVETQKTDYVSLVRGTKTDDEVFLTDMIETSTYRPVVASSVDGNDEVKFRSELVDVRPVINITNSNSNKAPAVRMGSYPQVLVDDAELINELNNIEAEWVNDTILNYLYSPGVVAGKYKDVELNGEKYRAYMALGEVYDSAINLYNENDVTIKWYKYMPLLWTKTNETKSFYVCNSMIDMGRLSNSTSSRIYYYENSSLKDFIRNDMSSIIFNENEKEKLHTPKYVDNITENYDIDAKGGSYFSEYGELFYHVPNYGASYSSHDYYDEVINKTEYLNTKIHYESSVGRVGKCVVDYSEYNNGNYIYNICPIIYLEHNIKNSERIEPTCTEVGYEETTYCEDCDDIGPKQGKEIPALGHIYSTIYYWLYENEDGEGYLDGKWYDILEENEFNVNSLDDVEIDKYIVIAGLMCDREDDPLSMGEVTLSVDKKEPTCENEGKITINAHIEYELSEFNEDTSITFTSPTVDHEYINPTETFNWNEDNTECKAVYYCKYNPEHTVEVDCIVSNIINEADCTKDGKITYKAYATYDGITSTGTKTEIINKKEHNYRVSSWKWSDNLNECIAVFTCKECKDAVEVGCDIENINNIGTCVTAGSEIYIARCTFEDVLYTDIKTEIKEIPGHNIVTDERVEPTCEKSGLTEGSHCSECGNIIIKQEIIDATGHNAGEAIKENNIDVTCTADGSYEMVTYCTKCDKELKRDKYITSKLGHNYSGSVIKEATCAEEGTERFICPRCGDYYDKVINKTEHEYKNAVYQEPTCTEEGVIRYSCLNCDNYYDETLPAAGHKPDDAKVINKVDAACTSDGSYDIAVCCSVCEKELNKTHVIVPATGHRMGEPEFINNINSSCETEGSYDVVIKCVICETEMSSKHITVSPAGHRAGEVKIINKVEPTCTEDGSYTAVVNCNVCEKELSRTEMTVNAKGHKLSEAEIINKIEATCTEDGGYDAIIKCTVCKEELDKTHIVLTAGHKLGDPQITNEKAATCTEDGGHDVIVNCVVCKEEISRKHVTVSAAGHKAGEPKVINKTEPSCTDDGSYDIIINCTVCEAELSNVHVTVPAYGHRYNDIYYKWSENNSECTATAKCANCDSVITETVDTEYKVTTEPTTENDGVGTFTAEFNKDIFDTQTKVINIIKLNKPEESTSETTTTKENKTETTTKEETRPGSERETDTTTTTEVTTTEKETTTKKEVTTKKETTTIKDTTTSTTSTTKKEESKTEKNESATVETKPSTTKEETTTVINKETTKEDKTNTVKVPDTGNRSILSVLIALFVSIIVGVFASTKTLFKKTTV